MSDDEINLSTRVKELEEELAAKEAELAHTRLRLTAANTRLEKIIEDVAQELKMASKIQKLLSPVELPHIQGFEMSSRFRPGMKIGGDYFDVFEHRDKLRFGIVLSCCSGYSLSALFLSVLIRMSSRMEAKAGLKADEMLMSLAQEMQPEMQVKDKASLFYGIVDRRTYEFHYACRGSILAMVQKPGQDHLEILEPSAEHLSKDSKSKVVTQTLSLQSKERLILCGEGLVRPTNKQGQVWPISEVEEALRRTSRQGVHEARNEILYQCEKFLDSDEPDRDQTVLVLEVKDKILKLAPVNA